ncbi:MAG: helix-turn-helix domain-containing protein [Christensenellales bacterium]
MFKNLLKKYLLTQTKIAIVLNCNQTLVSKWCRGICEPSINAIINMHEHFNIPIEEIVLSFKKERANGK